MIHIFTLSSILTNCLFLGFLQAKRLPYRDAMVTQVHRGSSSQGSWIGEMQQASDKSVIISEILDPRTKNLLSMSKISDYVLSNELVSMALAMVAEDRQINDVLEELFAEEVVFLSMIMRNTHTACSKHLTKAHKTFILFPRYICGNNSQKTSHVTLAC